jgi:hypothetical protein
MNRVIVIGHSLTDKNIRDVLEMAKQGATVQRPVVWIAPNISELDRREYLNKFRIRVVSYDDKNGRHNNLVKLIQSVNEFIPSRVLTNVKQDIEKVLPIAIHTSAVSSFYVFNEVCKQTEYDKKRIEIVNSAIESSLPEINELGTFTLEQALEVAGWPTDVKIDEEFARQITEFAISKNAIVKNEDRYQVNSDYLKISLEKRTEFQKKRSHFIKSVELRIRKEFPELTEVDAKVLAVDIEASFIKYCNDSGLSIASLLFTKGAERTIPVSIFPIIKNESVKYETHTKRQAVFKVTLDIIKYPEENEVVYLGRILQGYFGFHGLGVFGDVAKERLNQAKNTVWLIDSDTQIKLLALGESANLLYKSQFKRTKELGFRYFTTDSLLKETRAHLWFAHNKILEYGQNSPYIGAAAVGDAPFRKSNAFLEGFIKWQAAGNPGGWESYFFSIFGVTKYDEINLQKTLLSLGIEVVDLTTWPGFSKEDYTNIESYAKKLIEIKEEHKILVDGEELEFDAYKKAKPEAEAFEIIKSERNGKYYIISAAGKTHEAWFISYTSILNIVEEKIVVTWQPQAFSSFCSTLCNESESEIAKRAFDRIVLGLAQSGMNSIGEDIIKQVFGNVIEQAKINIEELRQQYKENLQGKYGEPIDTVLSRINVKFLPLVTTQLALESAQRANQRRIQAEEVAASANKRAEISERKSKKFDKFTNKVQQKLWERKKKSNTKKHKHRKI